MTTFRQQHHRHSFAWMMVMMMMVSTMCALGCASTNPSRRATVFVPVNSLASAHGHGNGGDETDAKSDLNTSGRARSRHDDPELVALLRADAELASLVDDAVAAKRRVQILLAIPSSDAAAGDGGGDGAAPAGGLRRLEFRADAEYFYPASAVKLCSAVAAIEKLGELRSEFPKAKLDLATTMIRFVDLEASSGARHVLNTTIRNEVEKALVLSDNDAHNRLFQFVGRDELAERMARTGLHTARLLQLLGSSSETVDSASMSLSPPIIELIPGKGAAAGAKPIAVAQRVGFELPTNSFTGDELLVGSAFVDDDGHTVSHAMDFSQKNSIALRDLQDLLIGVVAPSLPASVAAAATAHPKLSAKDRQSLLSTLRTLPSELKGARHLSKTRRDALDEQQKPFHKALTRALPKDSIHVYSKSGRAYGFAVENAYAINKTTGRSLFVAATIYANDNNTLNDDRYEYTTVADPFLTRLAAVLAHAFLAAN